MIVSGRYFLYLLKNKENQSLKSLIYTIFVVVALLMCNSAESFAKSRYGHDPLTRQADSIMDKVIFYAPFYERMVDDYEAHLYIKGKVNIKRKNFILRYLPNMFRMRHGIRKYMVETYSDLHYTAPDIYDQKITATMGTASEMWEMDGQMPQFFHVNIYSSTLLYDKLISPLSPDARKYYRFRIDSVMGNNHNRSYRIRFMPRYKSFQLVGGYITVTGNVWSIREMRFFGRNEMLRFDNLVKMGEVGTADEFLPVRYDIESTFKFVGNVVEGSYTAMLDYKTISHHVASEQILRKRRKSKYDLTDSYTLRTDGQAVFYDTAHFNRLRPIPLQEDETQLYREYFEKKVDTLQKKKPSKFQKTIDFWWNVGDALISNYTLDMKENGSVRFSPIISPVLMSYSASSGFAYRQRFYYTKLFGNDCYLQVAPHMGYNFKKKEFYWNVESHYDYWPEKRAALHLDFGNGNRIYNSQVLDDLKAIPDSLFDFNQIHLDYFKDLYCNFSHSWEIVNGLTLDVGLSLHHRSEVERSKFVLKNPSNLEGGNLNFDFEALEKFRHTYNSFAPRVRLSYTPGQYYYMYGSRKINLHSNYPTFSVDYERGIDGIFKNSGRYERVEMDVQHHLILSPMRDLYWRLGWGTFTNQEELYFVDFANLRNSNLPMGWEDDMSGVFQLLDGRWYNSSRKYVRGHGVYEAPFLLLRHLRKYTQYVLNERLYLNALVVPHLNPYLEVGYGIGTHLFDFGLFASFSNWKYERVGVKFTLELFNR